MEWNKHKERNKRIKELRRSGCSIKQIARELRCSQSVASLHSKGVAIIDVVAYNKRAKIRDFKKLASFNSRMLDEKRKKVREEAIRDWNLYKIDRQFTAFLAFYWSEGTKKSGYISMTNNDPGVILFCDRMFDKFCPGSTRETVIKCYPEHDKTICKQYWVKLLGRDVKVNDKTWLARHVGYIQNLVYVLFDLVTGYFIIRFLLGWICGEKRFYGA